MLGLGCMRLSTDARRDDARAAEVLGAALDAGVTLLDTADCYGLDDADRGHSEELIARVIAGRSATHVTVVTKGGLERPGGAWVANGRAKHLAAAARASRARLGGAAIDLYLLHAVDPRTPLATSVRALAAVRDDGVARAIGLANVGVHQLEAALAIARVAPLVAVEVELSPYQLDALRGGLIAACAQRDIRVLAHRPLGGPAGVRRLARDPVVAEIAARHAATPAEVALAWVRQLAPNVVPLPGATTIATARSAARAVVLDDDAVRALHAHWVAVTGARPAPVAVPRAPAEVVMIMGMPAAGKSTLAAELAATGHMRLNRDDRGGSLLDLARALDRALAAGATRVVLDNTYGTRASRAPVIEVARRHHAPVRCLELTTSLEDAQANAAARIIAEHGRLLEPAEATRAHAIAPSAQFRYRRAYEPPHADEGFAAIEQVVFTRTARPGRLALSGRPALIVELDDVIWRGRPTAPADVVIGAEVGAWLAAWAAAGYALTATSWQPEADAAALAALDARVAELLPDTPLAIVHCAHPAGPPVCWCRKPLPGLALVLAHAHGLGLSRSVVIGRAPTDHGFATRAGCRYLEVNLVNGAHGSLPSP